MTRHQSLIRLALCALILLAMTSCAMPRLVHPTKGDREFAADSSTCEALGRQAQDPRAKYHFTKLRVYDQCMFGKGWNEQRS